VGIVQHVSKNSVSIIQVWSLGDSGTSALYVVWVVATGKIKLSCSTQNCQ
jgi:hypothetical protein